MKIRSDWLRPLTAIEMIDFFHVSQQDLINSRDIELPLTANSKNSEKLKGMKVLLVEDSVDNQELFTIYLNRQGADISVAQDGLEGMQKALAHDYDVVLMDVQMPKMDGITAVQKLRAGGYKKPVIALTAHAMKEERARCLNAGFTDFLSKPFNCNDLIEKIQYQVH
ncbi:MAG: response regulator [Bdellovibrionaceae bacterium]|nr:response regulator [Bdellovibrio sp.]